VLTYYIVRHHPRQWKNTFSCPYWVLPFTVTQPWQIFVLIFITYSGGVKAVIIVEFAPIVPDADIVKVGAHVVCVIRLAQ